MTKKNNSKQNSGGNLGFESELFKAADLLRGNMEPSDYKHIALGLIFLKYISDAFEGKHRELLKEGDEVAEDKDEYLAENIFWVPKEARWSYLQANAKLPTIGGLIDDAMRAIEKDNESLKGVLPKEYARPAINKVMLGELIDLISGIALNEDSDRSKDILGRVYEYFLGEFAGAEGKRGGEFYTPRSIVRLLVEMLQPYSGRIYDPCCGSGGMFVQSEKFVQEHGGRIGAIVIYGQESNYTTWRLAKMNLAVRGIDSDIRWNNEGSFHKDELRDLKADYILANPPFNVSEWGGETNNRHTSDTNDCHSRAPNDCHSRASNDCHSRESGNLKPYKDIPGFCKSATLDDIRKHGYVLTPGRYVGAAEQEEDGEPFEEKMQRLSTQWREQQAEAAKLDAMIETNLNSLGFKRHDQ